MYHNRAHRKLGRTHTHRLATLRSLSTALFSHERIKTTLMKAKELRPFAEKLITKSKRDDLHARRLVMRHIQDRDVARKLFDTLSARYMDRQGGYMRIMKLGRRQGDGAEMALVELLGSEPAFAKAEGKKKRSLTDRLMGGRRSKAAEADAEAPASPAEEASGDETQAAAPAKKAAAEPRRKADPKAKAGKGAKKDTKKDTKKGKK